MLKYHFYFVETAGTSEYNHHLKFKTSQIPILCIVTITLKIVLHIKISKI